MKHSATTLLVSTVLLVGLGSTVAPGMGQAAPAPASVVQTAPDLGAATVAAPISRKYVYDGGRKFLAPQTGVKWLAETRNGTAVYRIVGTTGPNRGSTWAVVTAGRSQTGTIWNVYGATAQPGSTWA